MSDMFAQLAAPFPPEAISWRPGSMSKDKTKAKALAYLDARDVMDRLDAVCHPGGWQCRYPHAGTKTVCEIGIRVDGEWVWKSNGAGDSDIEAEKGALSDAFKRAAVLWGIGRYLYGIDSPWVRINEWRQIEKDELPKLRALLGGAKPKSAYQSRKDGDWKLLANQLRECGSVDAVTAFLEANADLLAQMPAQWSDHWQRLVEQTIDAARARAA